MGGVWIIVNKRILILGGGFAGAYTALHRERRLAGIPDVEIVLAKKNFVLFTPMLHDATCPAAVLADNIVAEMRGQPLRPLPTLRSATMSEPEGPSDRRCAETRIGNAGT